MGTGVSNEGLFMVRIKKIVEANLCNEQFGVNELAEKMGLSRSQIHRKLKSICNKSVSQFIREVRLEKAKELLEDQSLTSSEIAYKVGFGSPSYFIKSFHDYFGYPPGEFSKYASGNQEKENKITRVDAVTDKKSIIKFDHRRTWILALLIIIATVVILYLIVQNRNIRNAQSSVENTILVIPFKNLSSDEKQYFSEGLSNTIRTQLGKISGFKIISGPTAEQFWESALLPIEMARRVNANYILTGDAQLQDNNVLINIYLSDARQGAILWSENYNRVVNDFFGIQLEIARNVVDELHVILSPNEIEQIEKLQPKNFEAYNNYLMGQYFCLKRDSASIFKGIDYFNEAIQLDPDYTLAYAGLADGYYALSFTGNIDRTTGYALAYEMAQKALAKDATLAEAYAVLGVVSYFGYWEWEKARGFFEKAFEVDSNCMVAHLYHCSFLDIVGEPEKALDHANKAIELEPYFHMPYHMKGVIYHNEKKFLPSTEAFNRSIELNPEYWRSCSYNFFNFLHLNNDSLTKESLFQFFSIHPNYQKYKNEVTVVWDVSGINDVLNLFLHTTLEYGTPDNWLLVASLNNLLGRQNEALTNLEIACRERNSDIPRMIHIPELESLHSNPRFQALVDTMNLRPYYTLTTK